MIYVNILEGALLVTLIVIIFILKQKLNTMANTLQGVLQTLQAEATTLTSIQSGIASLAGGGLQPGQVAVEQTDIDALQTQASANASAATGILSSLPAQTAAPAPTPPPAT
jgi:hypothetical protein